MATSESREVTALVLDEINKAIYSCDLAHGNARYQSSFRLLFVGGYCRVPHGSHISLVVHDDLQVPFQQREG